MQERFAMSSCGGGAVIRGMGMVWRRLHRGKGKKDYALSFHIVMTFEIFSFLTK